MLMHNYVQATECPLQKNNLPSSTSGKGVLRHRLGAGPFLSQSPHEPVPVPVGGAHSHDVHEHDTLFTSTCLY